MAELDIFALWSKKIKGATSEVGNLLEIGDGGFLAWLRQGKPVGDATYKEILATNETAYCAGLEAGGHTGSVIAIAEPLT